MSETKLTNQSAFTIAAKGMLAQGEQSGGGSQFCNYRTFTKDKKLCCGIGFLVTDELGAQMDLGVLKDGEDTSISSVIAIEEVKEVLGHLDIMLLGDIQQVHDSDPVECWEDCLKEVAVEYNLKWEL